MTQTAFQVRFTVSRPKYKSFVVSGIVLASTQVKAVEVSKKTLVETLAESNDGSTIKLLSAAPLKNDFFLIAQEELREPIQSDKILESIDDASENNK